MAPIRGQNKSSAGHLASYQMNAIEGRPIPGTLSHATSCQVLGRLPRNLDRPGQKITG